MPRQDSRQAKAAVGCDPHRKAAWLRHSCIEASPARPHRRQGKFRITKDESSSRIGAGLIDRGVVRSRHGGRPVGEPPSFMAVCPPASGKARDCTTWRGNACRPQRPAQAAVRVFWNRLPSPKHSVLIGPMNKNRDGESHFAIGQSLSDYCRAARTEKAGRRGGVVCLRRCVAPK